MLKQNIVNIICYKKQYIEFCNIIFVTTIKINQRKTWQYKKSKSSATLNDRQKCFDFLLFQIYYIILNFYPFYNGFDFFEKWTV